MGIVYSEQLAVSNYVSQRDPMVNLSVYIGAALAPWNRDTFDVSISEVGAYGVNEIIIQTKLLPELPFVYRFHETIDQEELVLALCFAAYEFFRNRPTLPIDDHIILGEN